MDTVNIESVTYTAPSGQPVTLALHAPLDCPVTCGPETLCRLVLPRLPLSPSACLLLGLILDEHVAGLPVQHTYAEVGAILGRGHHTAVRAAAELRQAGLLVTVRAGFRSSRMSFLCGPLLAWARSVVSPEIAQDAPEGTSTPSVASPAQSPVRTSSAAPETRSAAFQDTIVDDRPDWPAVPADWRARYGIPLPENDDCPSMAIPRGVKPWLGPIPRLAGGGFDMDKLVRMPHQLVIDDDVAFHAYCQAKGDAPDRTPSEMKLDDPAVDASEEREAERRLDGSRTDDGEDTFSFASGTETSATDMGHGVRVNPDL